MEYICFGFLCHIVAFQEDFLVPNRLFPRHVLSNSLFLVNLGPNCDNVLWQFRFVSITRCQVGPVEKDLDTSLFAIMVRSCCQVTGRPLPIRAAKNIPVVRLCRSIVEGLFV